LFFHSITPTDNNVCYQMFQLLPSLRTLSCYSAIEDVSVDEGSAHLSQSTSPSSVSKLVVPRDDFLKLAQQQRFAEMESILTRPQEYDLQEWLFLEKKKTKANKVGTLQENYNLHLFRGETPLHVILPYQPTEAVVNRLIHFLSSSKKSQSVPEDAVDMLGRTPLHVAAASGCSASVIQRLLNGVSGIMPAVAKDFTGRHALHYACANINGAPPAQLRRRKGWNKKNTSEPEFDPVENMVSVVFHLLSAYPDAALIRDHDGQTPMELVRAQRAHPCVIKLLNQAIFMCNMERSCGRLRSPLSANKHFKEISTAEFSASDTDLIEDMLEVSESEDVSSIGTHGVSLLFSTKSPHQVTRLETDIEL